MVEVAVYEAYHTTLPDRHPQHVTRFGRSSPVKMGMRGAIDVRQGRAGKDDDRHLIERRTERREPNPGTKTLTTGIELGGLSRLTAT